MKKKPVLFNRKIYFPFSSFSTEKKGGGLGLELMRPYKCSWPRRPHFVLYKFENVSLFIFPANASCINRWSKVPRSEYKNCRLDRIELTEREKSAVMCCWSVARLSKCVRVRVGHWVRCTVTYKLVWTLWWGRGGLWANWHCAEHRKRIYWQPQQKGR